MAQKKIIKARIIEKINDLPPIPKIVNRLRNMVNDPKTSAREIAELMRQDEALTARVIKVSNSVYFGLVQRISSVQQAVAFLGMTTLYNLVLAGSISGLFQRGLAGYRYKRGELWEHALFTAFCSDLIARRKGYRKLAPTAFTAGILHDVGKLIINEHLRVGMEEVIRLLKKEGATWLMAEKEVVGFTHTEIGAAVAKKWRFSPELIECILHHHFPQYSHGHRELVNIIHIATALAIREGYAVEIDAAHYKFSRKALTSLRIDKEDMKAIVTHMRENFDPSAMY